VIIAGTTLSSNLWHEYTQEGIGDSAEYMQLINRHGVLTQLHVCSSYDICTLLVLKYIIAGSFLSRKISKQEEERHSFYSMSVNELVAGWALCRFTMYT